MKISVSTDGKDVVVEMSKEKGERIFNKIVAMLLQPDTEDNNPESHIAPKQEKKAEKPEEEYKGFIYMKCPECGTAQALDDALRGSDMPEEEKQAYKEGILKAIYR